MFDKRSPVSLVGRALDFKSNGQGFKSLIGRLLFIFSALLSIYGLKTYRHNFINNVLRHYPYKLAKQET